MRLNIKKPTDISFDIDENGVIGYSDSFCKHCYSHKVTKYGYNKRDLINDDVNMLLQKFRDIIVQFMVNILKQSLKDNMKIIVIFLMKLKKNQLVFVK